MRLRLFTTLSIAGLLALSACSGADTPETTSPERLYNEAQAEAESGGLFGSRDCFSAERKVEELRRRFPYHSATLDGELILAECAYDEGRTMEAIGRWEAFVRFHRDNQRSVSVWLSLAGAYKSLYDDYDRDLGSVKQALHASTTVIRNAPKSDEAHDAVEIRQWAREILAKREYYVAKKYRRDKDYLSAKGRLEGLIERYPGTEAARQAQPDLEKLDKRLDFPAVPPESTGG